MSDTITRLWRLTKVHLSCNLDDKIKGVPEDLIPGTYRWYLYLYTNLFGEGDDFISRENKLLLIALSKRLRPHDMISWTRRRLIEVPEEKVTELRRFVLRRIHRTESCNELRACLYLARVLSNRVRVIDEVSKKRLGIPDYFHL